MAVLSRGAGRGRDLTAADLMGHPAVFGGVLLVVTVDRLGLEALGWHPTTLRLELAQELGRPPAPANWDRLQAAIAVVTTDLFRTSLDDFIRICNVLSGDTADPRFWDPADAAEVAWGLTEAGLLDPPDPDDPPWNEQILGYIQHVTRQEGVLIPPDILAIAGGPDPDLLRRAAAVAATRPDVSAAWADVARARAAAIVQTLRRTLRAWAEQLGNVTLQQGDARRLRDAILERIDRAVP